LFAGHRPKAIVLDLVQPLAARGYLIGFSWKAQRDEAGKAMYARSM
jgi:hypothetical protein